MAPPPSARWNERASTRYHAPAAAALVLVAAVVSAAATHAAADAMPSGRRVVSLSPAGSEILLLLGLAERMVGADPESARRLGLPGLAVVEDVRGIARLSPDLVLVAPAQALAVRRAAPGAEVLEVAPDDFDDAWALCRSLGEALGETAAVHRAVRELSRPLAQVAAASFGRRRPLVLAVTSLDPLEIAGGHSFVTDLIEAAGGESAGHGSEAPRVAWSPEEIRAAAPELALWVGAGEPDAVARVQAILGPGVAVQTLSVDPARIWLEDPAPTALRIRAWLDALAGPGAPTKPSTGGASNR